MQMVTLPYPQRSPRFLSSPWINMVIMLSIALGIGASLFGGEHVEAQAVNDHCTLIVPAHPLTAKGLATPYQLVATNSKMGPCHEVNPAQATFVQGAVLDQATDTLSVYNPLVIDKGTKPAIAPVVPRLPKDAIVALWFGFNGAVLKLQETDNSLREGQCVNGLDGSFFGQFAYCNAPTFFVAANRAIRTGRLVPPPLGRAKDGQMCPSVRDFSVVDMDQSDNVTTTYLALENGRTAQDTAANRAKLKDFTALINPSDNKLLVGFIDPALGCKAWMVPDLADNGRLTTALPLNELQASVRQRPPIALVPAGDPMVLVNGRPNLQKINLYRAGVDQPPAESLSQASTVTYCKNLLDIAPERLFLDAPLTKQAPSPDPAMANTLFTFLAQRFNTTWGPAGLNCRDLLHQKSPITVTVNAQGVAINATLRISHHGEGK
jgi:hypothetical protein